MKADYHSSLFLPTCIVRDRIPSSLLNVDLWSTNPPTQPLTHPPIINGRRGWAASLTIEDWRNFYHEELLKTPIDEGDPGVFGSIQSSVPLDHRSAIFKWMCDTCQASKWSPSTFFTACHAFDGYVLRATHFIDPMSLGSVSAACLYYAAHIRESLSDSNIMTLEKFRSLCPDIGSPSKVREYEAHVLEVLQGLTMGVRCPREVLLLWLASMIDHPLLGRSFQHFSNNGVLDYVMTVILNLSIYSYMNGLCLVVRGSTWLAASLTLCVLALHDGLNNTGATVLKENRYPDRSTKVVSELYAFLTLDMMELVDLVASDVDLSLSRRICSFGSIHHMGRSHVG
eukprot:Blabericola_migrator_1__1694@NODE_1456_length_4515_cov_129_363534_g962_i0_p1_GENE_NODE_1456_length_4515_cov_129_363534_g962_i0NODE_1456_length_4515_cov_129_363534_g962_i0_p1_ORF_typecomplete_len341_score33_93Cyclin_N/PF00134_23/2_5e09_NODE_1456_length_4515_cov_129_363534_g962_i019392961